MFLALAMMGVIAFIFVGWAKKKGWVRRNEANVKIMASLPLGKDVFFVLRCGPEVWALTSGPGGTRLLSRWKYDEWLVLEEKTQQDDGLGNDSKHES
jgi:hypothetical protein